MSAEREGRIVGSVLQTDADPADWIGSLDAEPRAAVLQSMTERRLRCADVVCRHGEAPSELYLVRSGRVRLFALTQEGREVLLRFFGPGQTLGDLACIDGEPYPANARAQGDCVLGVLRRERLNELRAQFPAIDKALLRSVAKTARIVLRFFEEATLLPLPARVAARLFWLAGTARASGARTAMLKLAQSDLALMLGASRQSINQILHELQSAGVLSAKYGAIWIHDLARLEAISKGPFPSPQVDRARSPVVAMSVTRD